MPLPVLYQNPWNIHWLNLTFSPCVLFPVNTGDKGGFYDSSSNLSSHFTYYFALCNMQTSATLTSETIPTVHDISWLENNVICGKSSPETRRIFKKRNFYTSHLSVSPRAPSHKRLGTTVNIASTLPPAWFSRLEASISRERRLQNLSSGVIWAPADLSGPE